MTFLILTVINVKEKQSRRQKLSSLRVMNPLSPPGTLTPGLFKPTCKPPVTTGVAKSKVLQL